MKQKRLAVDDVLIENNVCKDVRKIIFGYIKNDHLIRQNIAANSNFFVFFSKTGNKGIIIRKSIINTNKPKRFIHMLTWNLETDEICPGQWLINKKINLNKASLSPNGDLFIYPLTISKGPYQDYIPNGVEKLTVISKPPYFSGLLVLRSNLSAYGDVYNHMLGGKWINNDHVLLNSSYSIDNGYIPPWLTLSTTSNAPNGNEHSETERLSKFNVKDLREMTKNNSFFREKVSHLKKDELISKIIIANHKKFAHDLSESHDHIQLSKHNKQFDTLGREVWIDDGYLFVNGKIIYDFIKDEFKQVTKPINYDW